MCCLLETKDSCLFVGYLWIYREAAPNTATAQMRYIDYEYMDITPVNDGDI